MNIKSPSRHIDAAIIPGPALESVGVWLKRAFAGLLVLLSLYGTYAQVAGFSSDNPGAAALLAVGYQLVVSLAQFAFRRQWQSIWYVGALGASVVPSILTYGPIVAPNLTNTITGFIGYDMAQGTSWAIVGIVMLLADIVPEQILVRR